MLHASFLCFTPSFLSPGLTPNSITTITTTTLPKAAGSRIYIPTRKTNSQCYNKIKVIAAATANSASAAQDASTAQDAYTVDYNTMTSSVFPAEACETVGGEACDVEMYPEVKLTQPESKSSQARTASEMVDREYLDYNNSKTVFPGEACDDLGGEFCEPEYQTGVY